MILFELTNSEQEPNYQSLQISNGERHYSFLQSVVDTAIKIQKPFLSQVVIKAINFHAIACLHTNAGEFRPCEVVVGTHRPPEWFRVQALMDDFINYVNLNWKEADPLELAAFVLWRMNYIHPFINGNGRTARATAYFILCCKVGGWLPGAKILPELLRENRNEYVIALQRADESYQSGSLDISVLHGLISRLLKEQLNAVVESTQPSPSTP